MHTNTTVHLASTARPTVSIGRLMPEGRPYLILTISDPSEAGTSVTLFPAGPEFLDYLANECERGVREFVGDVPGGQATLTSAAVTIPVNFTFPEPTTVVVP